MSDAKSRILRTVLQLIAGGALTALTEQLATDMPAAYAPYLLIGYTLLVTAVQNYAEDAGLMKPVAKKASGGDTEAA